MLELITTTITEKEILSNIRDDYKEAVRLLKKYKNNLAIINIFNADVINDIVNEENIEKVIATIEKEYSEFIIGSKTKMINVSNIDPEEVFRDYFSGVKPFSKPKSRPEFPDSFILKSIEEWAKQHKKCVYIITTDNGMVEYCNTSRQLLALGSVDELFNLIARDEKRYDDIINYVNESADEICDIAKEQLEYVEFTCDDCYFDTYEIDDVYINDRDVISIDKSKVLIKLHFEIKLTVTNEYTSTELSMWEEDIKKYWQTENKSESAEASAYIFGILKLGINDEKSEEINILDMKLNIDSSNIISMNILSAFE